MPRTNKKGFTIIEVVLVLAIGGLIFLMVFIALPALQRSRRDSQRRQDVGRFMSQIESYAANNRGNVPAATTASINTTNTGFLDSYMKRNTGEFKDPQTGNNYTVTFGVANNANATESNLVYATTAKCSGENIIAGAGTRSVAVKIKLEGSGFYCQDNQ